MLGPLITFRLVSLAALAPGDRNRDRQREQRREDGQEEAKRGFEVPSDVDDVGDVGGHQNEQEERLPRTNPGPGRQEERHRKPPDVCC